MWAEECKEVLFTEESRICLQHHYVQIRFWRHNGERMLNSFVMHRITGPAPPHWYYDSVGIGCHSRTPLVRIYGTLNIQRYISEPIENMLSMVAQRLTQILLPAAPPYQIWQRVEADRSDVPKNTSKVSFNQCLGVWHR
ncbi:transposable element Tcb1 transposase [Trichonephila clavipes]|nr:transposable element Tcb1 transposase [Trichonephila clavipes]